MTTKDEDFPAAHSMDSVWFAVDRDGRVALFTTGEAGAMPEAAGGEESENLYEALDQLPRRSDEIVEPYRHLQKGDEPIHETLSMVTPERSWGQYTVLLDKPDLFQKEIAEGRAKLLRAAQGCAVHLGEMSYELVKKLHDDKVCRGCFMDFRREEENKISVAERGLYVYGHTCENWISGPYGREAAPATPLSAKDLPQEARERLVELPLSFAESPFIQPAEHVECFSWESAWLELDGKHVHAFPEHEEEAKKMYSKGGDLDDMELIFVDDEAEED